MSHCEIASVSGQQKVDYIHLNFFAEFKSTQRIHPCQKPIQLYDDLFKRYAQPTDRILDTHLGSGSSAIAAHYFGCDFVGLEIDQDYHAAACQRFEDETRQLDMLKDETKATRKAS